MTKELFKFAGAVLDCYDDPSFVDSVQAKACFDKHLVSPEKVADLPEDQFAVKIASRTGYKKRFPIYNEFVTKISCHYFENSYVDLPVELQKSAGYNLGQACERFGIEKTAHVSEHSKSPASRIVEHITKEAAAPMMATEKLAKFAEERLATELSKMRPANRTKAATSFYKAAGTVERQDVWDYVEKPVAGPMLEGALDDRDSIMKTASPEQRCIFEQIRSEVEDMEPQEAVAALIEFDKYAELNVRYKDGLVDPYLAVYGGWRTPKFCQDVEDGKLAKIAEVVDGQTGDRVDPETARGLSVEQHLFNLQKRFPKHSDSFSKAASAPASPDMEQKYGPNYIKARKIYFGV